MHVGAAGQDADAVVFDVVGHEAFGKDLGAVEGALQSSSFYGTMRENVDRDIGQLLRRS